MKGYDEVIEFLGEWGPFQKLMFILLSLSTIPNGYCGMAVVFLADIPPHRCRLPHLNSSGWELEANDSVPREEVKGKLVPSRCSRFKEPGDLLATGGGNETEGCLDGWEFSQERYISTIVTEWNLVCGDAWKVPFTMTVFFLGVLTGSFLCGYISDRYGRKNIFFATMALQTVFSLIQAASNSWEMFAVLYFVVGMGTIANYCAAFILGSELFVKSTRVTFGTLAVTMCFAVGYLILPLAAYFIRSWRFLLLALSLPGFLYIPLWWYIPESPRWLVSRGRMDEAEAIICAAAQKNGVRVPDVLFERDESSGMINEGNKGSQHQYSWLDLLKTTNIRNITLLNIFLWLVIAMTYYGISLNTPNMDGDPYLNCLVSALSEMAGYVVVWLFVRCTRRRLTLSLSLLVCGVTLLLIKLIPEDLSALSISLAMAGKMAISGAFAFVYLYATELFPTVVRNNGIGITSMASRIGSSISPYIAHIGTYNKILPYVLMGSVTISIGVLSLLLPETKDEPLPDSISEVKPLHCTCGKKDPPANPKHEEKNQTEDELDNIHK